MIAADRLGLDQLSVFGLPPPAFVALAAGIGCGRISLATAPVVALRGEAPWSLRHDAPLRRETAAALADRGVRVAIGEGCRIAPGHDVADLAADLDVLAALGAPRVNGYSIEPDPSRNEDQYGRLAALAAERGMAVAIEFAPIMAVPTLAAAAALAGRIGVAGTGIVVDLMHFGRGGGTAAELAALDPALIGHVQLCDTTLAPGPRGYGYEAGFERTAPGDGELPLADLLAALPAEVTIGLEIPRRSKIEAGITLEASLRECAAKARAVLAA